MNNPKEFTVVIEKKLKVTLDMDKYKGELLDQLRGYWGYDDYSFSDEDVIQEIVEMIAHRFERDGFYDPEQEGVLKEGQTCKQVNSNLYIEE